MQFDGDESTPLLWVLRDELGLTGTKYGCGIGQCGACTVHVNGVAQRACITPVSAANNATVTTIEGLAPASDKLHPVQQAWLEHDVPQCGYCQAGQIMATADLLRRIPQPSDKDIDDNLSNICRCGTYARIRTAIHRAAELSAKAGNNGD
jgi:isoquinoline 1-oxidoreductase alpha subunit